MIPETMQAVKLTGHGGLDKLVHRDDVAVPTPGWDEVLIEVSACGMNNTDVWGREGGYGSGSDTDPQAGSPGAAGAPRSACRASRAPTSWAGSPRDSSFRGTVLDTATVGEHRALDSQITGQAWVLAHSRIVIDLDDPLVDASDLQHLLTT